MFLNMDDSMSNSTQSKTWSLNQTLATLTMWIIMTIGMMTPSATPVILLYYKLSQKHQLDKFNLIPTGAFFLGYLSIWIVFGSIATIFQMFLSKVQLLSPIITIYNSLFNGILLISIGIYQLSPYKYICLQHCRSPLEFLSKHWRYGSRGAFQMGLEHGAYCLGCCWALMTLLFVGGITNLFVIALISILILLEKIFVFGKIVSQETAIFCIVWGILLVLINFL
jgi:predicted metal-binding membrane protein